MRIELNSIKLENVTFGYQEGTPVFENLDFEVPGGHLLWLRSAQGMGKSSLLRILAGLAIPQAGHYWINGEDVLQMSFQEFLPYRLAIGYSFENGGLLANRSLYDNLMLPLRFHGTWVEEDARMRVLYWMEKFDLLKVKDQLPFAVTGSHRKCTVLLRAFIHHPQLVLLDDPMSGLKEEGQKAFVELLEEAVFKNGLRHVLFCGENELPKKTLPLKKLELSYHKNQKAERAA